MDAYIGLIKKKWAGLLLCVGCGVRWEVPAQINKRAELGF